MIGASDPTFHLQLTPDDLAAVTGGVWRPGPPPEGALSQVFAHVPEDAPAACLFAVPSGRHTADETLNRIRAAEARGASAILVDTATATAGLFAVPCLVVPGDVSKALQDIAAAVRDLSPARRVLVTGTEGKTGFKLLLAHMLAGQCRVQTRRANGNMTDQIAVLLATLQPWHDVAVIEVAAPTRAAARKRSTLVRPHLCAITEVGYEHLVSHGDDAAIIEDKASVVEACDPAGTVIIPAVTARHARLRDAVERRFGGRVLTFGLGADVDARLTERTFDHDRWGWHVRASVAGACVSLFAPRIEEHAPVSCLGPLLACHALGHDVAMAAEAMSDYRPFRTEGVLRRLTFGQRRVLLVDKSQRAYLLGQIDLLRTLARLRPPPGGRKILVWGEVYDRREYGDTVHALLPPDTVRPLIEEATIDRIYTCGDRRDFRLLLPGSVDWAQHVESDPIKMLGSLLNDLKDNDLLVIYGDRNERMPKLAKALQDKADAHTDV